MTYWKFRYVNLHPHFDGFPQARFPAVNHCVKDNNIRSAFDTYRSIAFLGFAFVHPALSTGKGSGWVGGSSPIWLSQEHEVLSYKEKKDQLGQNNGTLF